MNIDQDALKALNEDIYERACVDREHLLKFLTLIPTSDGKVVAESVKSWLDILHTDPKYDKIYFPTGDIDAILADLDSYERVQPDTIHMLKEQSVRELTA